MNLSLSMPSRSCRKDYQLIDTAQADEERVCSHMQHKIRNVPSNHLIEAMVTMINQEIQSKVKAKIFVFLENTSLAQSMTGVFEHSNEQSAYEVFEINLDMNLQKRKTTAKMFQEVDSAVLFCTHESTKGVRFHPHPTLVVHVGLVDRAEYVGRMLVSI